MRTACGGEGGQGEEWFADNRRRRAPTKRADGLKSSYDGIS